MHGAKVARTVIKNWSHIQQRAVRTMSYSVSKSVENVAGNAFEFGLSASKTVAGKEKGVELSFGMAVASGRPTFLRDSGALTVTRETQIAHHTRMLATVATFLGNPCAFFLIDD